MAALTSSGGGTMMSLELLWGGPGWTQGLGPGLPALSWAETATTPRSFHGDAARLAW